MGEPTEGHYFFTSARPGRTGNPASKFGAVPDDVVHRWILGLPKPNTAIVSLLGRKPDGLSEFSFYSFYGGFDLPSEHSARLSLREWVERWHGDKLIVVREHPTCDFTPLGAETLDAIAQDMYDLLSIGRTVVLVDSGGDTRVGMVCRHIGATEDSTQF